jgi:molybdopterin synthase sulfur carrier subunit
VTQARIDRRHGPVCNPPVPTVEFAPALTRHVACPRQEVGAKTRAAALDAAFRAAPALRGYVLDEQGAVRKHVAVFVNGQMIPSRSDLTRALQPQDSVVVIQALSGG